ncbi:MAG: Spermidine N(1)-acetyltransferase [Firmicutes bacterium]|nr:Spermidine N(1)-acetyltransferase [Bacillota bacterium]
MFAGDKVRIRAIEKSDIDHVMKWVNNRAITQYLLAFTLPVSRLAEEKWVERAAIHGDADKFFAIETLQGEYLGNCGLHGIDSINRHCELGIVIGQENFLGRGYGQDTIRLLLRACFDVLNLNKIFLRVFSGNMRAIKCYEGCGFKQVGRLKEHRADYKQANS